MNKQQIVPSFNKKLTASLNNFAAKFNVPSSEIRIVISPLSKQNQDAVSSFSYNVYGKQGLLCNAQFSDIVKLDILEAAFISQKKVEEYITDSLVKFGIAAVCDIYVFDVMIFFNSEGGIKLALLKDKKILNYFTVDKLF